MTDMKRPEQSHAIVSEVDNYLRRNGYDFVLITRGGGAVFGHGAHFLERLGAVQHENSRLEADRDRLRKILSRLYEGIDDHWQTLPKNVDVVAEAALAAREHDERLTHMSDLQLASNARQCASDILEVADPFINGDPKGLEFYGMVKGLEMLLDELNARLEGRA